MLVVLMPRGQDGSGPLSGEGQLTEKMAKGRETAPKADKTSQKELGCN